MKDPWFNVPTLYAFKGAIALGALVLLLTIVAVAAVRVYDRYALKYDCAAVAK